MAIYYVRKTGSDAAAGTSAGAAWLTIGKALGAAGISSGDTVYIGAGVYREVVTVAMTSAVAETFVIGDVTGQHTGDAGIVRWTNYTTDDVTAPPTSTVLNLATRSYLTFENIYFQRGNSGGVLVDSGATGATNIKLIRCLFYAQNAATCITKTVPFGQSSQWVIENCIFMHRSIGISLTLVTGAGSDYDSTFLVKNCLFIALAGSASFAITSSGAGAQEGGGVTVANCSRYGGSAAFVVITGTAIGGSAFTYPVVVVNCVISCGAGGALQAGETGALVEEYNYINAATPRTLVSVGTGSVDNDTRAAHAHFGESFLWGMQPRPFGMLMESSPLLGFGAATSPVVTTDALGIPRPSGGGSNLKSIGWLERNNTAKRETSTVRTGANAARITGPGVQDFDIPVDATATTVAIYARWNGTYAGTKPELKVLNGGGCGVVNATDLATGAIDTWEQLSLTFTPTSRGIVTIRFQSNDTNGAGQTFWDDMTVT